MTSVPADGEANLRAGRPTVKKNVSVPQTTSVLRMPVRQEFYGLLMAHFAVRGLMHEAALKSGEDPDRLSFLHAVRVIRRKMAIFGTIPPSEQKRIP